MEWGIQAAYLPLILYNIPQTVGRSIPLDAVDKLSRHPNIVGIKDSENDIDRLENEIDLRSGRGDFVHLVGCAALSAHGVSKGSDGIVPSAGNIVPDLYRSLYEAASKGDMERANRLQEETNEVGQLYQEGRNLPDSLAALKVIMNHFDFCQRHVLPPLTACIDNEVQEIVSRIFFNKHLQVLTQ